jgi:hypothetical protein
MKSGSFRECCEVAQEPIAVVPTKHHEVAEVSLMRGQPSEDRVTPMSSRDRDRPAATRSLRPAECNGKKRRYVARNVRVPIP